MYTCQNCGATADDSSRLCKPSSEEQETKFCGIPTKQICEEEVSPMNYKCVACGSMSAFVEHLCSPSLIKR
jgi:hypothetical protein